MLPNNLWGDLDDAEMLQATTENRQDRSLVAKIASIRPSEDANLLSPPSPQKKKKTSNSAATAHSTSGSSTSSSIVSASPGSES